MRWIEQALQQSLGSHDFFALFLAVLVAYLGGILSSLTPCIYPMIPITLSVVTGIDDDKKSSLSILKKGIAYILGMTVIYSFLGVAAGLTGQIFGSLTQTWGWYLGLSIIMAFSALWMMDVIQLDPQVWLHRVKKNKKNHHHHTPHQKKTKGPYLSAFLLGASSGFIAAPCTTPVLAAILSYITKSQSVIYGLALMIAFSFGLGTLLLLIALFAGKIKFLPKSGSWMKTIKTLGGCLLLAFSLYLMFKAGQLK